MSTMKGNRQLKQQSVLTLIGLLFLALIITACGGDKDDGWRVYFTNIKDGDTVTSPVTLEWDAEGFTIEPAGEVKDGAGHLHLIVDLPCVVAGETVPADDNHLHYGKAQLTATVDLAPGSHTLCLQAADGVHSALAGDGATELIEITVE